MAAKSIVSGLENDRLFVCSDTFYFNALRKITDRTFVVIVIDNDGTFGDLPQPVGRKLQFDLARLSAVVKRKFGRCKFGIQFLGRYGFETDGRRLRDRNLLYILNIPLPD